MHTQFWNFWKKGLYLVVCLSMLFTSLPPAAMAAPPLQEPDAIPPIEETPPPTPTPTPQPVDVGAASDDPVIYLPLIIKSGSDEPLPPPPPPEGTEVLIRPSIGGIVGPGDGSVRATFSPQSVEQDTWVRYQLIERPAIVTPGLAVGGLAFSMTAWEDATGDPVTEFPPEVTIIPGTEDTPAYAVITPSIVISMYYTDTDVWGLDLRTLSLYAREGPDDTWERVPTAVYQDQNLLVAEVDHLSEFVPLGELLAVSDLDVRKRLALDPDDDVGWAVWPGVGTVREITCNMRLACETKQRLEDDNCQVDILLTRGSESQGFVSRSLRAQMANNFGAEMFTTLAFNALTGSPWGIESDGGVRGWARNGYPDDDALVNEFFNRITQYTGRPHTRPVQHPPPYYPPYPEFESLSGTCGHIEVLFLDHNYDWPVINTGFSYITDATYAALRTRLEVMGMTCGDPNNPPPLPLPPSAVQLQRWRDLGYQNYQRYGADPVSFSTGNHVVQVKLFRIPGRGGLDFDFTLTYNSQDGRDDLFGYGWSFPYNARAIHYSDDSVGVVLPDGRTYHYTWNGSGYDAPASVYEILEKAADGWRWTTPDETVLTFQETVSGLGILTEWRDRWGSAFHFSYDLSGQDNWQNGDPVPRPPLTEIRDNAGRTITFTSNGDSHITGLTLPDDRTFTFGYTDGDLTAISDGNGGTRRFQYDARHRMTHEEDPEQITWLQNIYDDRDRVVEQIDASGTHSFLDYDPINRVTTFTDNLGNQEVYHWDELNRVTGEQDASGGQVSNEYDADYNLIRRTGANGHTTRYEYDERGNLTARHDPIPAGVTYTSDVTRWTYDARNLVTSMTNALNYTWTYEYDAAGNLIHTIAPYSSETWAAYNAWGQPTVITDANGHTTRYQYDPYGNRTHTIDHYGNVTVSEYDAAGREIRYTDANGHTVEFEYDGNDNIIRIWDPKHVPSTFEYDGNDLLIRSVDRRGGERLYQYDENLKLVAERDREEHWTYYGYDDLYHRVTMTDALGYATHYAYDEAGRLISVTDPTGATTRYEYDDNGNQTAVIDPLGHRTRMVYDAVNRLKYLIDAAGNRTEYCYDAEDQLVRVIGPRGEVTDSTYDAVGRLIAVKDPLGEVTQYEYDGVGNRLAETDPLNHRTDYEYDALDWLTTIARPELSGGDRPTTQFGYDAVGNTLVITSPRGFATTFSHDANDNVVTITDPMGGQTTHTYDAEDNPVTVTDPSDHAVTTTYDLMGNPVQIQDAMGYTTTLAYDGVYNLVQQVNAMGKATEYEYDPAGRLIQETDPLDNATEYARDALGRVIAVTDANGHTTGYDYDPLGRFIAVTDALNQTTRYAYDAAGNLTTIEDANGHVTKFDYNFLNQLVQETNPLTNTWRYSYDAAGNLIRRVDGEWQAVHYEYDSNNRLAEIRYPDASDQFTYDLDGNETQMCDSLGCTAHTYDALGRRTSTSDWLGRTITRTYDAVGNLTGLTYPNPSTGSGQGGYTVTYTYNANDWLTAFSDPHGAGSDYQYNPLGQVTRILHPNSTVASFTYDDAGRLTGVDNRKLLAAQPQSAYACAMDKVGNRTQVIETRAAFDGSPAAVVIPHTYQYDALDRLARAATDAPPSDTAYAFDAVGNRLGKTGIVLAPDPGLPELPVAPRPEAVTYTYNEANQLTHIQEADAETALDYNGNGDRIRETEVLTDGTMLITEYTYDYEDRLVGVSKTVSDTAGITVTIAATYTYDGYGRRVRKEVSNLQSPISNTQVITYLYDGLDIIGAQLAMGDTMTETYYYLAPSPVTGLRRPLEMERLPNLATGFPGDRHWYQADGMDSIVALTDESGNLVSPFLYDEYGQMLAGMTDLQIFTYTAQDYDPETGLYHFYARYYDPMRGVWLTQDKWRGMQSLPLTLHHYAYAKNSPVTQVDVLGYGLKEWILNQLRDKAQRYYNNQNWDGLWRVYWMLASGGLAGYHHASYHMFRFLYKWGDIEYKGWTVNWVRYAECVRSRIPDVQRDIETQIKNHVRGGRLSGNVYTRRWGVYPNPASEGDLYYAMNAFELWAEGYYEAVRNRGDSGKYRVGVQATFRFEDRYDWHPGLAAGGGVGGLGGFKDEWAKALVNHGRAKEFGVRGYWSEKMHFDIDVESAEGSQEVQPGGARSSRIWWTITWRYIEPRALSGKERAD